MHRYIRGMRPGICAIFIVFAAAAPVFGQIVVAPDDFEALSEGRTLYFTHQGEAFGAEQYFQGRRSLWRYGDGTCQSGVWHAEGSQICFVYEGIAGQQCWLFQRDGQRLRAVLVPEAGAEDFALDLSRTDEAALPCPGPDVGS